MSTIQDTIIWERWGHTYDFTNVTKLRHGVNMRLMAKRGCIKCGGKGFIAEFQKRVNRESYGSGVGMGCKCLVETALPLDFLTVIKKEVKTVMKW